MAQSFCVGFLSSWVTVLPSTKDVVAIGPGGTPACWLRATANVFQRTLALRARSQERIESCCWLSVRSASARTYYASAQRWRFRGRIDGVIATRTGTHGHGRGTMHGAARGARARVSQACLHARTRSQVAIDSISIATYTRYAYARARAYTAAARAPAAGAVRVEYVSIAGAGAGAGAGADAGAAALNSNGRRMHARALRMRMLQLLGCRTTSWSTLFAYACMRNSS